MKKYYIIPVNKLECSVEKMSDSKFVTTATKYGRVLTQTEFEQQWNVCRVYPEYEVLRIL